jgi:spermidine/putrescine transport system permease protein
VLPLFASLETIDKRYVEAAQDLYASPRTSFWRITVPLSAPGIVAGSLLTFIPAVGDYINANFLGGPNNRMIGNVVQGLYLTERNYPLAASLSFVLMALITVVVAIYLRIAGSRTLTGDDLSELG